MFDNSSYEKELFRMEIQDMYLEINLFCDEYTGTVIGEETRCRLENLRNDDYDGVKDLYDELEAAGRL